MIHPHKPGHLACKSDCRYVFHPASKLIAYLFHTGNRGSYQIVSLLDKDAGLWPLIPDRLCPERYAGAVSYTHLDVYKRQHIM